MSGQVPTPRGWPPPPPSRDRGARAARGSLQGTKGQGRRSGGTSPVPHWGWGGKGLIRSLAECGRAPSPRGSQRGRVPGDWGPAPPLTCQQLLQALVEGLQLPLVHQPLGPQELGDEAHGRGNLADHAGPGVQRGMHGGGRRPARSRGWRRPAHGPGAAGAAAASSSSSAPAASSSRSGCSAAAAAPAAPRASPAERSCPPRAASYSPARPEMASGGRAAGAANLTIAPL